MPRFNTIIALIVLDLFLLPAGAFTKDPSPLDSLHSLHHVHARYYQIHSDLDPDFVAELARRMDAMFEQYQKQFADFKMPADQPPLDVFLFQRRDSYMGFTRLGGSNTGGVFVASPFPYLASFLEGQGRDELRRTLQHEAFHHFAYYAISKNIPTWLNEGLATDFEEGIWTGKSFLMGQIPPRRVRQLHSDITGGALVPLVDFLNITPEQWAQTLRHDLSKGTTFYNESWAMTFYLREVDRGDDHNRYVRFLEKLHENQDQAQAFKETLGQGIPEFQQRFERWANTLTATPASTLIERDSALADLLQLLGSKGQTFDNIKSFREDVIKHHYIINYSSRRMKWTGETNPANYFCDANNQPYSSVDLHFTPSPDGPYPDIVCRATDKLQVRTHFYQGEKGIEHEVLVEPAVH